MVVDRSLLMGDLIDEGLVGLEGHGETCLMGHNIIYIISIFNQKKTLRHAPEL